MSLFGLLHERVELCQQLRGHRRRDQAVPAGDGAHRVGELLDGDLLQEVSARTGLHGGVEVLLAVGDREHDHLRVGETLADASRGFDARRPGHAHVHDDHVGRHLLRSVDGLDPVGGLADDLDVGLLGEDEVQAAPEQRVVVDDDDADGLALVHPVVSITPRLPSRRRYRTAA